MAQGERIEIDGGRHCTCTPHCCFCSGQHGQSSPPQLDRFWCWSCGVCGERLTGALTDPCSNCTVIPDLRGLDLHPAAFQADPVVLLDCIEEADQYDHHAWQVLVNTIRGTLALATPGAQVDADALRRQIALGLEEADR